MIKKSKIAILSIGGTIAGYSDCRLDYTDYTPGYYHIDDLLNELYEIKEIADIKTEQLGNLDSCQLNKTHWFLLKEKIEYYLNKLQFDGVVILHGTDTLEETAYFLHLTVYSNKPVVLVGAQRPFSALSTDSKINLYNAVKVAAVADSHDKGVLAVLNNEINGARDVRKTNTYRLQAFQSGQMGILGYIDVDGTVQYYRKPTRLGTCQSIFAKNQLGDLPEVAILYAHAGSSSDIVQYVVDSGRYKGIVMAGTGAGMFSSEEEAALRTAVKKGLTVVRSSRTGNGRVIKLKQFEGSGFINADNLSPQKARILLMLALSVTSSQGEIQDLFNTY